MKNLFSICLVAILSMGCQKKAESIDSLDEIQASVEGGVTVISGVADEQSNGSFADNRKSLSTYAYKVKNLLLPEAWAANCSRAVSEPCVNGVRTTTYSNCQVPFTNVTVSGLVTLAYSDAACSMQNNGDQVERTEEVSINGPYSGTLKISTAQHTDYRGVSLGGGGRLIKTVGGWSLEVLGKNSSYIRRSRELLNISTRTIAPLNVTGTLSRASRVVDGGSFEVIHNKAKFVATYTPHNLAWNSACCHPVSGTLDVAYSGSLNGSGVVTFNGCGTADLEKDGLSQQISINYCE